MATIDSSREGRENALRSQTEKAPPPQSNSWPVYGLIGFSMMVCAILLVSLRNYPHVQIAVLAYQYLVLLPIFLISHKRLPRSFAGNLALSREITFAALCAFMLFAGWLGWCGARGQLNPDESGYGFYARTLLSGRLMAVPLPGAPADVTKTPVALFFTGHIMRPYGWFTHFPPGWPLVLSLGYWLHSPGLVNPVLSLVLLILTAAIARYCYGIATGRLAILISILSPFFLVNSVMRMSHMLCSVFAAGACLLLFHGLRSNKVMLLMSAFALSGLSCFVRPYTGFALAAIIGVSALWCVRKNPPLLAKVALAGVLLGGLTIMGMMLYNRSYTGQPLVSPYAQMVGANAPPELSLNPARIWEGIRIYGRRAFQETLFSTFPFVFLLAGYTLLREEKSRRETIILATLYPILVLAYLLHPDGSGIFYGERFHFEAYFAVAILGAQGLELLAERSAIARPLWIAILTAFGLMQVAQLTVAAKVVLNSAAIYQRVRESAQHVAPPIGIVFLHGSDDFVAMHFNLNAPDWRKAPLVYLVDPGPAERSKWACRLARSDWVVLAYNSVTHSVDQQTGHNVCPATPTAE